MFSFLNFSFDSPTRDGREHSKAGKYGPDSGRKNKSSTFNWRSDSNTTSPTSSSAGTPKRIPLLCTPPPMKPPREAPSARPAMAFPPRDPKGYHGGVRKRRSSIFFKLPDTDKVRNGRSSHHSSSSSKTRVKDKDALAAPTTAETEKVKGQQQQQHLPTKLSRPSSRRRSRRASVAPAGGSPVRTRALRSPFGTGTEDALKLKLGCEDLPVGSAAAAAAAAAAAVAAEGFCSEGPRKDVVVGRVDSREGGEGEQLEALAEDRSVVLLSPKTPPPRSSPRALSAGHRRESCRDGGISRAPKLLSAARLLEDARDVASIRADAGLRANYQGVCWIASNWCVGETKGVLSGKRYLVLCDNIIWAELREVDRRSSVGEHEQAGFLPIISMTGATLEHCEVASSNNGWIIEVVNPATDVTLWLDPDNPTSLLRWGSVMCQALAKSAEEGCME